MFGTALMAALTVVIAPLTSPFSAVVGSVEPVRWSTRRAGADAGVADIVRWMLEHPDHVSLVVTGGPPSGDLTWNADLERPLGSTFKTIVLAAYAREVAAGRVDPDEVVPLEDIDHWLIEGTDGGSHARMMQRYATADGVRVDDLAAAMMIYSANTATDALLHHLGRTPILDAAEALGLPELAAAVAPPAGVLSLLRDEALGTTTGARLRALGRMDRNSANAAAWQQMDAFAADPSAAADTLVALSELTTWNDQLQLTDVLPWRARPDAMHQLLVRLLVERRLGPDATSIVERHASWPMEDPAIAAHFTKLAAKEGAAPGTLVVHATGRPRTGTAAGIDRTIVVSLHRLDADSWVSFFEGDAYQALGVRLLEDPAFAAELGQALSG